MNSDENPTFFPYFEHVDQVDLPVVIKRAGQILHGDQWKVGLARDLGISRGTLRNWLLGIHEARSDEILPKLLSILELRHKESVKLIAQIKRGIKP